MLHQDQFNKRKPANLIFSDETKSIAAGHTLEKKRARSE